MLPYCVAEIANACQRLGLEILSECMKQLFDQMQQELNMPQKAGLTRQLHYLHVQQLYIGPSTSTAVLAKMAAAGQEGMPYRQHIPQGCMDRIM